MIEEIRPIISIRNLVVKYRTYKNEVTALAGINLDVPEQRIVVIVGESGCGKSTLGLAIIGLLPSAAFIEDGQIVFRGRDITNLSFSELVQVRGTGISMIFQEPMSSLDPVYTVGNQLSETIAARDNKRKTEFRPHGIEEIAVNQREDLVSRLFIPQVSRNGRESRFSSEVIEALSRVEITDPENVAKKYPHELSGGMAQRVMIAESLLLKPSLLIADEPTSSLDVTTQAQVLFLMRDLLRDVERRSSASIVFITHDLAVASQIGDEIVVMYAGEIVEHAPVEDLFARPLHPYTEGLLNSFPKKYKSEGRLQAISGDVPNLQNLPTGCKFHTRCKYAFKRCIEENPKLNEVEHGHKVACFLRD